MLYQAQRFNQQHGCDRTPNQQPIRGYTISSQRAAADEALRLVDEQVHAIVRGVMVQWLDRLDWKRKEDEEWEYYKREGYKSQTAISHEEAAALWARSDGDGQISGSVTDGMVNKSLIGLGNVVSYSRQVEQDEQVRGLRTRAPAGQHFRPPSH